MDRAGIVDSSDLVGRTGTVVVRIRGADRPGEVHVLTHGTHELLIAYADDVIERDAEVLLVNLRGPRAVDVIPWTVELSVERT